MSNPHATNERIEAEAAAWVVTLHSGQATAADFARWRAWQSQSPAHEAAFVFAQRTWQALEVLRGDMPLVPLDSSSPIPPLGMIQETLLPRTTARRSFLSTWPIAAVVLLTVGLAVYVANPLVWLQADYHTKTGEIRQFSLSDGTTVQLNTHSAIALHFTERERRVEVLYGEAAFTVAKEEDRPFLVEAADIEACALGTRFIVQADRGRAQVTVLQHQVAVSSRENAPKLVVSTGETVRCDPSGSCGPVTAIDLTTITAWQRGKLIFDRVPLSTVVAELRRYRREFIVIADNQLTNRTVSGVFRLDDLDTALDTITAELRIEATHLPFLTLLH